MKSGLSSSAFPSAVTVRSSGRRTGSWSRGTGTVPQASQWTIGIGAPQARWREIGKSDARKRFVGRVTSGASGPRQQARRRIELLEDRLVGAVHGRDPEHRGRPEPGVDRGRDQHGQRMRDSRSDHRAAGLDERHLLQLAVVAHPPAVAELGELLEHAGLRRPALALGVVGRDERELGAGRRVGMGREERQRLAVQRRGVQLHAVDATQHGALRADAHPCSSAVSSGRRWSFSSA